MVIIPDADASEVHEPHTIPMTGWDAWLTVMEAAGYQCQCERMCSHHKGLKCGWENYPQRMLTAGPKHPTANPAASMAAASRGEDELIAWCRSCWDNAVTAARKAQRAMDAMPSDEPTLF